MKSRFGYNSWDKNPNKEALQQCFVQQQKNEARNDWNVPENVLSPMIYWIIDNPIPDQR